MLIENGNPLPSLTRINADAEPLALHARVVTGTGGGPDKTILNSPRYMQSAGYRLLCAYMRHPKDEGFAELERRARQWNAPLIAVDDFGPLDWRIPQRFRQICGAYGPTIWHSHDYKSNLLGLMMRRYHPMRLVTTVHGWVEHTWKTPLYYRIDKLCLPRYDAVVCVSRDLYDECRRIGVAKERLWHVANAIDTEEFHRKEPVESAKRKFGVSPTRLVIGAIGRLSKEKAYHLLVEAMREICNTGVDAELWIAGEGNQRDRLVRLALESGISERVKILGYRADTLALYHAMDLFVSSSVREGLPNVLLEAMALEVPVLCTRVAGIPDLIRDGENGLTVEAGSTDALAYAMRHILSDATLRQRLGVAGRATVEHSFSFRQRMEKIRAIYDRTIQGMEAAA